MITCLYNFVHLPQIYLVLIFPSQQKKPQLFLEWKNVVLEEMRALKKNDTWRLVKLPQDKSVVRCKWIFIMKFKPDGLIERYKTQLVAKGFTPTSIYEFHTNKYI